jgi:hypothetical protein
MVADSNSKNTITGTTDINAGVEDTAVTTIGNTTRGGEVNINSASKVTTTVGSNTVEVNNGEATQGVVVNALGTQDGISMTGTGETNGIVMNGTVGRATANMVLSGTQAAITNGNGTGLNVGNADTTLSGGSSTGTASKVTLANSRAFFIESSFIGVKHPSSRGKSS